MQHFCPLTLYSSVKSSFTELLNIMHIKYVHVKHFHKPNVPDDFSLNTDHTERSLFGQQENYLRMKVMPVVKKGRL